jgi:GTP cyclohydrolase I
MIDKNHIPDRDDDIDGYTKIDRYNPQLIESLSANYLDVLKQIGENPQREGLLKTPERIAKAMLFYPWL